MPFERSDSYESEKILTEEEVAKLEQQDSRLVNEFKANLLEKEAQKHWDLFYKRNENRFFKDRHWTTREFKDLININEEHKTILEVGCGVGNFIFPLIEETTKFKTIACDISSRAIQILKQNPLYKEDRINAFQCDITTYNIFEHIGEESADIATLIFVLSAIHPNKFLDTLKNIYRLLKPGGLLLFRDYGLYDMAQIRFKAGHKIAENFYMRQDGTRSYYFSTSYTQQIFESTGFTVLENGYIHRRTINKKENIDVPRIFLQAKLQKEI